MNAVAEKHQPQTLVESTAVSMFERLARDPSVDVDKLERLMAMNERMLALGAKQQFDAAFSEMQQDIPSITERGQISHNNKLISKYALFEDINDTLKPILQKHGFALSFRTRTDDKQMIVTGILSHRAGHREETSLPLPFDTSGAKNAVQAIGSSVSYGKRYVMCALLNITTRGEDDDGSGPKAVKMTDDHQATVESLCDEISPTILKSVLKSYKVESLAELPDDEYESIVKRLNITKAEKAGKGGAK